MKRWQKLLCSNQNRHRQWSGWPKIILLHNTSISLMVFSTLLHKDKGGTWRRPGISSPRHVRGKGVVMPACVNVYYMPCSWRKVGHAVDCQVLYLAGSSDARGQSRCIRVLLYAPFYRCIYVYNIRECPSHSHCFLPGIPCPQKSSGLSSDVNKLPSSGS